MNTKFFTNKHPNTLINKLKGIFENQAIQEFDALTGYFYASGYFALHPFLKEVPQIRILVGIEADKIIREIKQQGLMSFVDENKTREDYKQQFKKEIISKAPYSSQSEKSISQFIADIKSEKVKIKAHPTKNLHAKIFIFRPKNFNEHSHGEVITGSSNLTANGLGIDNDSHYEFNVLLRYYQDVKFASDEFETLWKEAVDLPPEHFETVKKETYLGFTPTPFELYIKFLIEYFGKEVAYNPNNIKDLPKGFKSLKYQIDAISQGYDILNRHHGVFLSDVVGLGKTIIAVMIARQFCFGNNFPEYRSRTLIITPPAIEQNWQDTKEKFDLSDVTIITTGSLHKNNSSRKIRSCYH